MSEVTLHNPSDIAISVARARDLFDDGDYHAALLLAEGIYDQAKAAASYAKRMKASEQLIEKSRRMQAEALSIESYSKIALADDYEQAQSAGLVASRGRPKKVEDDNLLRLEDVGLSKEQIFDARKLRDAEAKDPGIIGRAIEARLEAGLEPSRANLRAAIGTASASKEDRGENFYQTPEEATRTLLALESFAGTIWEPACGHGAISRVLEEHGYEIRISDLVDRGTCDAYGELQAVGDFLTSRRTSDEDGPDIVTNPPYGEVLNDFVAHALREHRPRKMALLLNLNFLCGFADDNRNFVMDENPPARVYVFKHRLPMMHREGWDGPKASSRMNTAWFVWELQSNATYGKSTALHRVDWMDFVDAEALDPGARSHAGNAEFVATAEPPRKTFDERLAEMRGPAREWVAQQTDFDRRELRCGVGLRDTIAEALIDEFMDRGLIGLADEQGRHMVLASPESEAA